MLVREVAEQDPNKRIGDVVLEKIAEFYTEERADALNAELVQLIPDVKVKLWFVPMPMGLVRSAALKALDAATPELVLRAARLVLHKAGLASSARHEHPASPFN